MHLCRDRAIADRPSRLAEGIDLTRELQDHVVEPQQALLGRAQPQLRLVPARMQPGDAGSLLEHPPALLRLGLDDLADATLVHQRGRARAGRGIGKQDLHVAGTHLAAVDTIGRARVTLDPATSSRVSCSLNCAGAFRALLSIWIATSALLRPGRWLVPEKITSSMSAARSDLCEVSPITQRNASTRLDLPQPLGSTTPVSPGSIMKSVGLMKDLKPSRLQSCEPRVDAVPIMEGEP